MGVVEILGHGADGEGAEVDCLAVWGCADAVDAGDVGEGAAGEVRAACSALDDAVEARGDECDADFFWVWGWW